MGCFFIDKIRNSIYTIYKKVSAQENILAYMFTEIRSIQLRGGVDMATSSITKNFYVKDQKTFERLKKELDSNPMRKQVVESSSLQRGKEKLATFVFR